MRAGRFGPPPVTSLRECFSPRILCPCRGTDLGTDRSTTRVPSAREENPRRLLVVSSDHRRRLRHSSVRWGAARLHRGHTPRLHDSGPRVHRRSRSTRPWGWPHAEGPASARCPPRSPPHGAVRNRGPATAERVAAIFPVPHEYRQLSPEEICAARPSGSSNRKAGVSGPTVSEGVALDSGPGARGNFF